MSLKGIISISGMPGLYKVLAQSKSGFIVESLVDKKRIPVASTQRISMLQDISVFTTSDDLPLTDVLIKMIEYSEKNPLIDSKAEPAKLKEFFVKIVPEFDSERVYPSDIKKIINWFHLVKDIVTIEDEPEAAAETAQAAETNEASTADATSEEKVTKKKRAAKANDSVENETSSETKEKAVSKPRKKKETQ